MSTGQARDVGMIGLSNLAHSIRRSTALYVAAMTSEPGTSEADLLARADRLANWVKGTAAERQEDITGSWQPEGY